MINDDISRVINVNEDIVKIISGGGYFVGRTENMGEV